MGHREEESVKEPKRISIGKLKVQGAWNVTERPGEKRIQEKRFSELSDASD